MSRFDIEDVLTDNLTAAINLLDPGRHCRMVAASPSHKIYLLRAALRQADDIGQRAGMSSPHYLVLKSDPEPVFPRGYNPAKSDLSQSLWIIL